MPFKCRASLSESSVDEIEALLPVKGVAPGYQWPAVDWRLYKLDILFVVRVYGCIENAPVAEWLIGA